jgi:hypothetical protein
MKQPIPFFISVVLVLLIGSSCQKEISPDNFDSTNTDGSYALRRIKIHHPSSSDPLDVVVSFQYDTVNRKLNIYFDDTTTSNPFDRLAATYQFDANGYLTRCDALDDYTSNAIRPDFAITRNSIGQIEKIIEFDAEELNGISYNDTVYYSYEQSGVQTIVQDSVRFYTNSYFNTRRTTYNSQNKPISEEYSTFNVSPGLNYSYINDRLSSATSSYNTTSFTYDNTIVSNEWQSLPQSLLGKDYYILKQSPLTFRLSYTFMSMILEPDFETVYNPLLTPPLSTIKVQGATFLDPDNFLTRTLNFATTYTADKLPATISVTSPGEDPSYYTFEYK